MRLNIDTICETLPENYRIKRYGYGDNQKRYSAPVLYEETCEWKKDTLYIARADILPNKNIPENIAIICVGRRLTKEWTGSNNEIVLVMQENSIFSVYNMVFSIFQDFDQWELKLLKELSNENSFDIHRFLHLGREKLGNPISVSDSSLRIILTTQNDIEETMMITEDYYELIQGICQVERMVKEPYLSSLISKDGKRHYCYNLYPLGYFSGCIWMSEDEHSFRKSDFLIAETFFAYFRKAFIMYFNKIGNSHSLASSVLHSILEHKMLTDEQESWLNLSDEESWQFFRLKENSNRKPMPKDYMCSMINTILPDTAFAVLHGGSIRGLWKYRENDPVRSDKDLQSFQDLLRRMEYTAYFSNCFTKIRSIGDQLFETSFLAREVNTFPDKPVVFFKDHILQYWLAQCSERLPASELYTDNFLLLKQYDEKKNTEYLHTLKTFLDKQCHITETARQLYINRSSLIKRLDKIKALLNTDLSDPEELLYYSILLRII